MFISLSKTLGKVGGFRIGIGKRITSKNAWWMCLVVCCVACLQLTWYMCVLSLWLVYAAMYGMWWVCKKLFVLIVSMIDHSSSGKLGVSSDPVAKLQQNTFAAKVERQVTEQVNMDATKYCPHCGAPVNEGKAFCVKCGSKLDI